MTVANILTTIRLILTPVFIAFFVLGRPAWAILVFSVAGFTDLIDGTVARILKQPSTKGALLDPLADKFLLESCFVGLLIVGVIPWWFFLLALARDLMIVSGIFYLEYRRMPIPYQAVLSSKLATLCQLAVAIYGMLIWWKPFLSYNYSIALIVTAIFIVVSGVQYITIGLKILKKKS